MPEDIEKELQRIILDFVWNGDWHPTISKETLYMRAQDGGLNLLDVKSRNEAMDLLWLKEYLTSGPNRPKWAFAADTLLARAVATASCNVDSLARVNTFLQQWDVSTRQAAGLPADLKRMVSAARKYNVRMESNNPAKELREALPIWYHLGMNVERYMGNSPSSRCLRENHGVTTVLHCVAVAARAAESTGHRKSVNCCCGACFDDWTVRNCDNPARCMEAAKRLTDQLQPKWNPLLIYPKDGLTLTRSRIRRNALAQETNGCIFFDPTLEDGPLTEDGIRVFAGMPDLPGCAVWRTPCCFEVEDEAVEIYVDGSCDRNGLDSAAAGSGLWYGPGDPRNRSLRVPGEQSNQSAEFYTVNVAVDTTPPFTPLHLITDSKYVLRGVTEFVSRWEDQGWVRVANAPLIWRVVAKLRAQSAPTSLRWVKGHSDDEGNEGADRLAAEGVCLDVTLPILPEKPAFLQKGAHLSTASQWTLYWGVRAACEAQHPVRWQMALMVEQICDGVEAALRFQPKLSALWKNLCCKDVTWKARDFLWKGMHDALRVGRFWENIPGYKLRATCGLCQETETLQHILLE